VLIVAEETLQKQYNS